MNRFLTMSLALSVSTAVHAGSGQTDKSEIISVVSEKLIGVLSSRFMSAAVKPKVHIAEINSTATVLDANDIVIIGDKFESGIIKNVVILDRDKTAFTSKEESLQLSGATSDALAMGAKLGASHLVFLDFREQLNKIDDETSKVTLVAKLTMVELATGRKVLAETTELKFKHREFGETYFLRNAVSNTLGLASIASLGASAAFGYAASTAKQNYDKAQSTSDAKTHREKSELNQKMAYGSLGLSVLTFGLKLWVDSSERNLTTYHEYQLTVLPSNGRNLLSGGYSWHF